MEEDKYNEKVLGKTIHIERTSNKPQIYQAAFGRWLSDIPEAFKFLTAFLAQKLLEHSAEFDYLIQIKHFLSK